MPKKNKFSNYDPNQFPNKLPPEFYNLDDPEYTAKILKIKKPIIPIRPVMEGTDGELIYEKICRDGCKKTITVKQNETLTDEQIKLLLSDDCNQIHDSSPGIELSEKESDDLLKWCLENSYSDNDV